jgi:hypothetical protein
MLIQATTTARLAAAGGDPRRAQAGATFRPTGPSSAIGRGAAAATPLASLDAVLALQALPGPTERRRRAVRRGTALLDALDELRLALLEGVAEATALARLEGLAGAAETDADEPALRRLMREIEIRAAVEIAKRASPTDRDSGAV